MNITTPHIKEQDANPYKREQIKIDPAGHQAIKDRVARVIAATCGGTPCVDHSWYHGNLLVSFKPSADPFYNSGEPGWYRWRLVSPDGLVRKLGPDAPCVDLSPSGAIFWLKKSNRRMTPKRISIEELFDRCKKLAEQAEVLS